MCVLVAALFVTNVYSFPFAPVQMFADNGIIAHNSQYPGSLFDELEVGDELSYCGKTYKVVGVYQYQAGDRFTDLETGKTLSPSALYQKMYNHPGEIVLQTCIRKGLNWEWGRLFVVAKNRTVLHGGR